MTRKKIGITMNGSIARKPRVSAGGHLSGFAVVGVTVCLMFATSSVAVFADETAVQDGVETAEVQPSASQARIRQTVELLASDAMEGRGLGTKGLDRAADYLSRQFSGIGLKSDLCGGGAFQPFMVHTRKHGDHHRVDWTGFLAEAAETGRESDGVSRERVVAPPVSEQEGVDARTNPDADPRSAPKSNAGVARRVDSRTDPRGNSAIAAAGRDSETSWPIEKPNNKSRVPTVKTALKNVVAVLEGEGPSAHETIVVGAHYDHLGERRGKDGERIIYRGANDNASGTAALLEVARILAQREGTLPRRVVFVAFSGEEHGLLGSLHYVNQSPVPLSDTIAMINLDMVGRMEGDSVMVMGMGSSPELARLTRQTAESHGIGLLPIPTTTPCSDHSPFYSRRIPVVFFCTIGDMRDYHQPTDTADKLHYPGIERIARMTADLTVAVAEAERRPRFTGEGVQGTLLRGAIRFFGNIAKQMASDKAEPGERRTPADENARPHVVPEKRQAAPEPAPAD